MSYLKIKGIILKEVNTGEADKVITILTKNKGRISGFAKGARRPKSKLVAGTQFLSYSDFVLYKGRDMYTVNSCDIIEPFYEIRNDIVRLTYAVHISELINDVIQEDQPSARVVQLLLNTLFMLTKSNKSPELITRIFEIRFLSILGYAPHVSSCMVCGRQDYNSMNFSFKNCGFYCNDCTINDKFAVRLSAGASKALNYIVHSRLEDLFSFNLSQDVLDELSRISKRYIRDRLERDYTKLDFLKTLNL